MGKVCLQPCFRFLQLRKQSEFPQPGHTKVAGFYKPDGTAGGTMIMAAAFFVFSEILRNLTLEVASTIGRLNGWMAFASYELILS